MKAFKYFSSHDWERYLGCSLYDKLKDVYKTNASLARAFDTPFNFEACKAITGLHVSTGLTGKMQGIKCITTACTANPNCIELHQCGGVCEHCYAFKYLRMRPNVRKCYERNTRVLSSDLLDVTVLPSFVPNDFVRFESFGDLVDFAHIENYLLIALKNPQTSFALFTKRRFILEAFFRSFEVKKPKNFAIVSSAYTMNDDQNTEVYASYETNDYLGFKLIDTVFNVYTSNENMEKKDRLAPHTHECEKQCQFCLVCWANKMADLMLVKEHLK